MSNITIKTFKLVPIKDFEKSDLNKDPKCHKGKDDGDDDDGDDGGDDDDDGDADDETWQEHICFPRSRHFHEL